jgi:rhodanese-related sulfurtransferase
MKRLSTIAVVVAIGMVLSLGLFGCSDDEITKPGVNEFEMLTELGDSYFTSYTTPAGLPVNVDAASVYAGLTDGNPSNDPYLLDWRSAAHFALGHIQGAVNVGSLTSVDFEDVLAAIPSGKRVVNVCYTGQTASYATSLMNMLGYEAQNLKFGMCGWTSDQSVNLAKWDNGINNDFAGWMSTQTYTSTQTQAGPSLNTGKSDPKDILMARVRSHFTAGWKTITAQALFNAVELDGKADDYFIINYFNEAEYNAGHIPGAVRFQPKQDFRLDQKLHLLPTDKKIVVYCYTGHTSAQVIAYLNALGYDAYTLVFGVNGMCYENVDICTTQYHAPATDYPVVTTP